MNTEDKIKNESMKLGGKAKEGVGGALGDEQMQAEGRGDQAEGGIRQAGERVKDAAKDIKDGLTGK